MGGTTVSPADINKAVSGLTAASNPSSGGALYGLPKDAQDAQFDVSGLPGLGSGQMHGSDVLRAFLAAGQSTDPQVRSIAAAIQHALYYGNYYDKSAIPTFGEVNKSDADALGRALNDLYQANQAQTGGSQSGQLTKMGVSQFLTSQAAVGAASGPNGPAQAVAPQVVNVRAPNAADVAATYRRSRSNCWVTGPTRRTRQRSSTRTHSSMWRTRKRTFRRSTTRRCRKRR
jgi:hypothetical protein